MTYQPETYFSLSLVLILVGEILIKVFVQQKNKLKKQNMKSIIVIISSVIIVSAYFIWVWPAVEFILYLVKDRPFNWWSVWTCLILWVTALAAFFGLAVFTARDKYTSKPSFSDRLKEMQSRGTRS